MALEEFVSGPYQATYKKSGGSAVFVGLTENGFNMQFTPQMEVIDTSDIYGGAILDAVKRGHNATLAFDLLSFKKALTSQIFWQFTSSPLVLWETALPSGVLYSSVAGEIVLTGQANTPAAVVDNNGGLGYANNVYGPNRVLTATYAVLSPGSSVAINSNSMLRKLPLQFTLLPYNTGAVVSPGQSGQGPVVFGVAS